MASQKLSLAAFDRRSALGTFGALVGAAGVGGFALPALAAPLPLWTFTGLYAIDGGRVLDGFIAAPNGVSQLNVILLIHDANGYDSLAEASAKRYARAGYCAIAPNLTTTCTAATYEARLTEIQALAPWLQQFPLGNGRVSIAPV